MDDGQVRSNAFVVCLTPLAKIFQPKYHKELMENLDDMFSKNKAFTIIASKPSGAVIMEYRKPKLITDPSVSNWLTGGPEGLWSKETDYTGIVYAPVGDDALEALTQLTSAYAEDPEKGKKTQDEIGKMLSSKYKSSMEKLALLSEQRVLRAIEFVVKNYRKQQELNKEQGMGSYRPSDTEFLCTYAWKFKDKESEKETKIKEKFAELWKDMQVV